MKFKLSNNAKETISFLIKMLILTVVSLGAAIIFDL